MKKLYVLCIILSVCFLLASCGKEAEQPLPAPGAPAETEESQQVPEAPAEPEEPAHETEIALKDGVYSAEFRTDSSMFHINEAYNNRGILTVEGGNMTIHITLPSKNILNLFYGLAEQAEEDGADLLQPTVDSVTYSDGYTEEVYGFDVPVPYLDEEFDCALIGTKGKWYDHKVYVTNPVPYMEDGEYTAAVTLTGGTGKASVSSPATIFVENGEMTAEIIWSSSHYEYMTIGEVQYDPVNTEGNSTFIIPITLDEDIEISALTTAMSQPHLIDYVLHFDSATLEKKGTS